MNASVTLSRVRLGAASVTRTVAILLRRLGATLLLPAADGFLRAPQEVGIVLGVIVRG